MEQFIGLLTAVVNLAAAIVLYRTARKDRKRKK